MGGQIIYDITLDKEVGSARSLDIVPAKLRFAVNKHGGDRYECFLTGVQYPADAETLPIEPLEMKPRSSKRSRHAWQFMGISGRANHDIYGPPLVFGDVVLKVAADGRTAMAKAFVGLEEDVATVASANWQD